MLQKLTAIAAWAALAVLVFATISPLGLRPVVTANPNIERFAAFAIVGLLFGLAYSRRLALDTLLMVIAAATLEAVQLMTPDRHAHCRRACKSSRRDLRRHAGINNFDHSSTPQKFARLCSASMIKLG
jgi:hypothetical protein